MATFGGELRGMAAILTGLSVTRPLPTSCRTP